MTGTEILIASAAALFVVAASVLAVCLVKIGQFDPDGDAE